MPSHRGESWFQELDSESQEIVTNNTENGMARDAFVQAAGEVMHHDNYIYLALSNLQIEPTLRLKAAIGDARKLAVTNPDANREISYLLTQLRDIWEEHQTGDGSAERMSLRDQEIQRKIKRIAELTAAIN